MASMRRLTVVAAAIAIALWIWVCARALTGDLASPTKFGAAVCAILIILPLLLRYLGRLPVYMLALYAALVPFNDLLQTQNGATVNKLLAIATGGALVISMLATRRVVPPSRTMYVLAALTLYVGATVFWAINQSDALTSYGIYLNYLLLFAAIALYPVTAADLKLIIGAAIAGGLGAAAYGDYLFLYANQGAHAYIANDTIDPNVYGATLLTPLALTVVLFLRSAMNRTKLLWLAAVLIAFSAMLVSASRGAMIAAVAMLLYLSIRSRFQKQFIALLPVAIVAIFASPVASRFAESDAATGNGRVEIWKVGLASLHQYWLFGAGIGNFPDAFAQYFLAVPHVVLPWDRVAHSVFVQSIVEYGVIGFVIVMAVWYCMFRELETARAPAGVADICEALRAGVLGLFVAGFSLDLMMYKYTWLTFSLVAVVRSYLVTTGVPLRSSQRERKKPRSGAPALGAAAYYPRPEP